MGGATASLSWCQTRQALHVSAQRTTASLIVVPTKARGDRVGLPVKIFET